jgi:hypothetical protein
LWSGSIEGTVIEAALMHAFLSAGKILAYNNLQLIGI